MNETQWKTLFAVAAAVVAFLLAQPDLALEPVVKVALGAVAVALAVMNPSDRATK